MKDKDLRNKLESNWPFPNVAAMKTAGDVLRYHEAEIEAVMPLAKEYGDERVSAFAQALTDELMKLGPDVRTSVVIALMTTLLNKKDA